MLAEKFYRQRQSVDEWVETIETKFSDIPFLDRPKNIKLILGIDDDDELIKIRTASLIVYGKIFGVFSFEDACNKLKIKEPSFVNLTKSEIAGRKLKIIIKALNNGWIPNWNDVNENKYFGRFRVKDGFSYWLTTADYLTNTAVPSALFLKNKELSYYCGLMFTYLYKDYLTSEEEYD